MPRKSVIDYDKIRQSLSLPAKHMPMTWRDRVDVNCKLCEKDIDGQVFWQYYEEQRWTYVDPKIYYFCSDCVKKEGCIRTPFWLEIIYNIGICFRYAFVATCVGD